MVKKLKRGKLRQNRFNEPLAAVIRNSPCTGIIMKNFLIAIDIKEKMIEREDALP